ncbi:uncharacterized protein LOC142827525 [Pelodiscus sinensis]|uniref:uncharacterized protein LOC142827525 n=1 Tax=Pelodiscus sinensis TaxID=13735 RepID=UPI003F6CD50E
MLGVQPRYKRLLGCSVGADRWGGRSSGPSCRPAAGPAARSRAGGGTAAATTSPGASTPPTPTPGGRPPRCRRRPCAPAPGTRPPDEAAASNPASPDPQETAFSLDGDFLEEQRNDPTLSRAWEQAGGPESRDRAPLGGPQGPRFEIRGDLLYRLTQDPQTQAEICQLLVPQRLRTTVLRLAHDVPWAGHLGREKTLCRLAQRFFWPGIHHAVRDYCASCPECQRANPGGVPRAPLVPLPVVGTPFERIGLDLVGPLEQSANKNKDILVIVDYATRYPEAIPLRVTTARAIADELLKVFARVGLPKTILTDQGTNVTSKLITELCRLLNIHSLRTSVYHPQTDGLVERFNRTLKSMLRKFVDDDPRQWDRWLPALLFAVREVPQASTGFSPFELLYGRRPRGILDLLRETWEGQERRAQGTIHYVLQLRERLEELGRLAQENLRTAQETQARHYNQKAKMRSFQPGDRVLLLLPSSESKLLAKWQGPFEVVRKIGPVDYEVRLPGRRKDLRVYHVNLLKAWREREAMMITPFPPEDELGPQVGALRENPQVDVGQDLKEGQKQQLQELIARFPHVLSAKPGRTPLISHHIATKPGQKVRDSHRPLPRKMWDTVRQELKEMLALGVVEESRSEWRSPIVLVPKPNGSVRFCIDFRKVNAISQFDAYPMPRVDVLLERLGRARYISTLDLTKGYWQIPLTPRTKAKTAFPTPFGLYQFTMMPFGLHGAAATFQRLMDQVLAPHNAYAAAYIDDIIVYSEGWEEHLTHLEEVLKALGEARLTANPAKCHLGKEEVTYLGYTVGKGQVKPVIDKIQALREYPTPTTKRQVRQFLGLVGYYRRFVPNFSTIAAPLTDLTKNQHPRRVEWSAECERAFQTLRDHLTRGPVLAQPDFDRPFILQTDASEVGLGAVLSQEVEGVEHPLLYLSRKLYPRETRYSTIEREALAVKWAVDALRYYLLGSTFLVVTDHAPLRWLQTMKDTNARIMRWYLALQPYSFQVAHRPGKVHGNADFLSRIAPKEEPPERNLLRGELILGNCGYF